MSQPNEDYKDITPEITPTVDELMRFRYEVADFPVWGITGVPCSYKIVAFDENGEQATSGGAVLRVIVTHNLGKKMKANVWDINDGSYRVEFVPSETGTYTCNVTFNDYTILSRPPIVQVKSRKFFS
jgi:hypothetical protein